MRIGIIGQKRAGKDTAYGILADILRERNGIVARRFAFADAMKEIVSDMLGIPLDILHDPDLKEEPYSEPTIINLARSIKHPHFEHYYKYALEHLGIQPMVSASKVARAMDMFVANMDTKDTRPRRYLQDFAETMRKEVDPFIWAILLEPKIQSIEQHQFAIITDVRHPEEIEFTLKGESSLVVLIVRPTCVDDKHASEQMAKMFATGDEPGVDVTINNDSDIPAFRVKLQQLVDWLLP